MRTLFVSFAAFLALSSAALAGDCYKNMCVGDRVIDIDSGFTDGIVVSLKDNQATIRSDSGQSWTETYPYLAVAKNACASLGFFKGELCVGETVYDIDSGFIQGRVVGIKEKDGTASFVYESDGGKRGMDTAAYLAIARDGLCADDLCVGDDVHDKDSAPYDATIVGIKTVNGTSYVMQYSNGSYGVDSKNYINLVRRADEARRLRAEKAQTLAEQEELQRLVNDGIADEANYRALRAQGLSHKDSLDQASGPAWLGPDTTQKFVLKLSRFVYGFDRNYLNDVAKILNADASSPQKNVFVSAALLPMLRALGYNGLKQKYIDKSSDKIAAMLKAYNMSSIADIESSALTRRLALQLLAASLNSAMIQMNDSQKASAQEILRALGDTLATGLRYRDMGQILRLVPSYKQLLLELAQNPYLQARAATDMGLVNYLENM